MQEGKNMEVICDRPNCTNKIIETAAIKYDDRFQGRVLKFCSAECAMDHLSSILVEAKKVVDSILHTWDH